MEIINSGSFVDLDEQTMKLIRKICVDKGIKEIHFECHFIHRQAIPKLRKEFASLGVKVKVKIGVETFDTHYREQVLRKGIGEKEPERIAVFMREIYPIYIENDRVDILLENTDFGVGGK